MTATPALNTIDSLKAALSTTQPDTVVQLRVGENSILIQLPAANLAQALGITLSPAVQPIMASTATPTMPIKTRTVKIKNDDFLRIRAQPTTASPEVARYLKNDVFDVIDDMPISADGHLWCKTADGRGYVAVDLTIGVDGSIFVPPSVDSFPTATNSTIRVLNTTTINQSPLSAWTFPFTAAQRGVGASAGGWSPDNNQLDLVKRNGVQVVYICGYEPGQAARAIPAFRSAGVQHFILRAAVHEAISTPERFIQITTPILQEYTAQLGTQDVMIAIHNEPNLVQEGWTRAWQNGVEFGTWFTKVAAAYRQLFSGVRIGFPALSPGGDVPGIRLNESTFLIQAAEAIQAADWVGVHYYWQNRDGSDINPPIDQWRQWYGSKPIIGTEVGPTDANVTSPGAVRMAYDRFAAIGVPAIGWILNGSGSWRNAAWDLNGIVL